MLTRGRKLTERNKHLNLRKQTKQKDENKYKPRDYKGDREGIPHIHPIP